MRRRDFLALAAGVPASGQILAPIVSGGAPGPMVSFTFDDIGVTDYTQAFPIFSARGVVGTSYAIGNAIGGASQISRTQMLEMQAGEWEFGSHTDTHVNLTTVPDDQLTRELRDSQHYLSGLGITHPEAIAYPFGANNATVQARSALYYRTGRSTEYQENTRPVVRYGLLVRPFGKTDTLAPAQAVIDAVQGKPKWVIFVCHDIDAQHAANMAALLDYIQAAGIPILPVREASNRMGVPAFSYTPAVNRLISGEDFSDTAYWTRGGGMSVTAGQIAAPVGTGLADLLTAAGSSSYLYNSRITLKPSTAYTFSVYLRAVTGTFSLRLGLWNGTLTMPLAESTITVTEEFQRFSVSASAASLVGNLATKPMIGGNSSWVAGENLYAAAAMVNEGVSALPYVPGIA